VVALLVGVFTLLDRANPAPTIRPEPTVPNISVDISTAEGGRQLAGFLGQHPSEVAHLDVRCFEKDPGEGTSCFTEQSGSDLPGEPSGGEYVWMWLFKERPCFDSFSEDSARDVELCEGEVLLWIDPRTDGTNANIGNIEGAGSVSVRGPWRVKSPFGGSIFGPTVEGYELTPAD